MSGEEIGREQKAKRLAREVLASAIRVLKEDVDGTEVMWMDMAQRLGVGMPSEFTRARVIEILEGICI